MAKKIYRKEKKNVNTWKTTCLPQINFLSKRPLNITYDRLGYRVYIEFTG